VKAVKNLVADSLIRTAILKTENAISKGVKHPKLIKLLELVKQNKDKKIIIFSQYRDMGSKIVQELNDIDVVSYLFIGQQKKKGLGLSQKKQKAILDKFRENEFKILVSSSVGEEGLDIPQVDLVIFYEPVPSAIKKIQRSGRTGRLEKGEVLVLSTKGTRDEAYHYVAIRKEKRMYAALSKVKKEIIYEDHKTKLTSYLPKDEKPTIYADYREKNSNVLRELAEKDFNIQLAKLDIGDYALSENTIVEYKRIPDFVESIIDGRLLSQLRNLKIARNPILIMEGQEDIYSIRKVHPNSIRGMIAAIISSYKIPLIHTQNPKETAELLAIITKRQFDQGAKPFSPHALKPLTIKDQQEYVVASFPGIGGILNKPLLEHFGTIKNIINATEKELKDVELIGPIKAKKLKELFEAEYLD
jgi:Fanconi anemia group M protein